MPKPLSDPGHIPAQPLGSEAALVERLRAGDESAFAELVDDLNGRLQALASTFTTSTPLAEDIVQETWLAVIRGLDGFEGRSSLRTWIFSILVRRARTVTAREARRQETLTPGGEAGDAPEWDLGRGRVGLWESAPEPWAVGNPESIYQSREVLEIVLSAVDGLPDAQRRVVLLRDVEDVAPSEICNILELTETNMRVLLHRGRARIRRALDRYLRDGARPPSVSAGNPEVENL